jgi:peptidoglycan/LPS O-acetylase OafA/YrhL
MPITSLAYPAVITALCVALCGWVAARDRWYGAELESAGQRFVAIDGLRGFLAIGVCFTHTIATYGYYHFGRWFSAFSPVHQAMGQCGVSLFFMITAFLFWRQAIRAKGAVDAPTLYRSRIRRLAPMYFASVAISFLVIGALTGFQLHESPAALAREIRPWLSFGFMTTGDVNGLKGAHIVDAVYWTLAWEWSFYLALPFIALLSRGFAFALLILAAVFFGTQAPLSLAFVCGVLAAEAYERGWLNGSLARAWLAPIPVAAIALALTFETAYNPVPMMALFVAFLFFVDGNTLAGLLATRAARLFGTVSYSFYLLHCIVLFVVFRMVDVAYGVATLNGSEHWTLAGVAAVTTTALSIFTYRRIEFPFIAHRAVPAPILAPALRPASPAA